MNTDTEISINHLPSRKKAGRKPWRLNAHLVGGKAEYFGTKSEAVARRNELLGVSVERGQSKATFCSAAADRVAVYKQRADRGDVKWTTFKDNRESADFWNNFFGSHELNAITPKDISYATELGYRIKHLGILRGACA